MRHIFSFVFLTSLVIGGIFLFRLTLTNTLLRVDIEELARYSLEEKRPSQTPTTTTKQDLTEQAKTEEQEDISLTQKKVPMVSEIIEEDSGTEVSTPDPLKKDSTITTPGSLSAAGVLRATNAERIKNGHTTLTSSVLLTEAANAKLKDMFQKQYFGHNSPTGRTPSDWVVDVGYTYKLTGENLALGNFSGFDRVFKRLCGGGNLL